MTARLHMPRVFDTKAVYSAWLQVLQAQFLSGQISRGKFYRRVKQAEQQWELELRYCPERETEPEYGGRAIADATGAGA